MATLHDIKALRQLLKEIERGDRKMSAAYQYLDGVQKKMDREDSDGENEMEEFIKPIQNMLQNSRREADKLREQEECLWSLLREGKTKKSSLSTRSIEQLDDEIGHLAAKLRKHIR